MTHIGDAKAASEFLANNPESLKVAQIVYESWEEIRDGIFSGFLDHLRDHIEQKAQEALSSWFDDLAIVCQYNYKPVYRTTLSVFRTSWEHTTEPNPASVGCTAVQLEAFTRQAGINGWYCGVCAAKSALKMSATEKLSYESLREKLPTDLGSGMSSPWYPHYKALDEEMGNWEKLMPQLLQETAGEKSEITDYFADELISTAELAIPIIDSVENGKGSPQN